MSSESSTSASWLQVPTSIWCTIGSLWGCVEGQNISSEVWFGCSVCFAAVLPSLFRFNWECLIVDEAHRLKNSSAHLYRALREVCVLCVCIECVHVLSIPIQFDVGVSLLMTGTPVQNNLSEVTTLVQSHQFAYCVMYVPFLSYIHFCHSWPHPLFHSQNLTCLSTILNKWRVSL